MQSQSAPPEACAAPPAAPPSQFVNPKAAIDSGAVAVSQVAAAAATRPSPASLAGTQQRQALQAAAAVATEAAADVLSEEEQWGERLGEELERLSDGGEEADALRQDMRDEVLPQGALVVTVDGKTALPADSPAKGAGGCAWRGGFACHRPCMLIAADAPVWHTHVAALHASACARALVAAA